MKNPYILIDGDLLINKKDFYEFVKTFDGKNSLIGVTKSSTDEAVYVDLDDKHRVIEFSRKKVIMSGLVLLV